MTKTNILYDMTSGILAKKQIALAVDCSVINNCLPVSCKMDPITSTHGERLMYLFTTDRQPAIF